MSAASHPGGDIAMPDLAERLRDRAHTEYYDIAIQYHVAARFAVQAKLWVVAGLLGHYAAEMYLKAYLSRHLNEAELKKLGHDLLKAWLEWVRISAVTDPYVAEAVGRLQPFWGIRYPEAIIATGMSLTVGLLLEHFTMVDEAGGEEILPDVPKYAFVLEDLDRLAHLVFKTDGANPMFFFAGLSPVAKQTLTQDNPTTTWADSVSAATVPGFAPAEAAE